MLQDNIDTQYSYSKNLKTMFLNDCIILRGNTNEIQHCCINKLLPLIFFTHLSVLHSYW